MEEYKNAKKKARECLDTLFPIMDERRGDALILCGLFQILGRYEQEIINSRDSEVQNG